MENETQAKPFGTTFENAAKNQYRRKTIYVVQLVKTSGEIVAIGSTSRKSITGMRDMISNNRTVQARIKQAGISLEQNFKNKKGTMLLDDGSVIRFGETIRSHSHGK
jgi:hypothetical protein